MKEAIAILTGGGPAPGMNTVVGSVAKTFLAKGYRVIGLHYGYSGLFNPNPRHEDLDFVKADYIFNQGGSYLTMSRFKPTDKDFEENFNLSFFQDNNVKLLVTVGGDDTASTANRIAKFLEAKHYPMIVIPEMFNKTEITVEKIVNLVVSSIIKRKLMGIEYGVAMISEGVFHALSDEEIRNSGIHFTYDDHGHPELGKVSKANIFNELLENKLKELKIKVKSRPVEIGYEVRCQTPIAYDLVYCSELGMGVYKLFSEGKTGCMVYISQDGFVSPLYLKDLQDPETGKIPPRLVNIESDKIQQVINNLMNYITPEDYEAAKAYVANPEAYDFKKILNW